jgi:hypothetical protein
MNRPWDSPRCAGGPRLSYSLTSQPYDLDQQEASNQHGHESDKAENDAPHNKGGRQSFPLADAGRS